MVTAQNINRLVPADSEVGKAVGVPKTYWFIARTVRNNTEKSSAGQLAKLGYETYVAVQEEIRKWKNGKRTKINRVVIPSVIFIHCTEAVRRQLVNLPFISRFMTNSAGSSKKGLHKPLATATDDEIKKLKFMLGASESEVKFVGHFVKGQMVQVVRGALCGLTGQIIRDADGHTSRLYVNIELLGSAYVEINPADVELIKSNATPT